MEKLKEIQKKLNEFMRNLQAQNPNANWKNLVTGVVILVLVSMFSIWYFDNPANVDLDLQEGNTSKNEDVSNESSMQEGLLENQTTVQAGEGLWQVAERVCNDGEAYIHIASENGLSVWDPVFEGQVLYINCGAK